MDLILSNTNYGAIEGVIERFKARFDEGEHTFGKSQSDVEF